MWLLLLACADPPPPPCEGVEDGGRCVPAACGRGPWGALPADADAIYVLQGAGGTGGAGDPIGSLEAGIALAVERGKREVIAGEGRYVERLELGADHDDLVIRGRCAALTALVAPDDGAPLVRYAAGRSTESVELSGISLEGGLYTLLAHRGVVVLEEVRVAGGLEVGLYIGPDAAVEASGLEVLDTRPSEEGFRGGGIFVDQGELVATGLRMSGNADFGIWQDGGSVVLEDARITGTQPVADGARLEHGVGLASAGSLRAGGLWLEDNHLYGLIVAGEAVIDGLTVLNTREGQGFDAGDDRVGIGVYVVDGGGLEAGDVLLEGNTGANLLSEGALTLYDAAVLSARPDPVYGQAAGVVIAGGEAALRSVELRDCAWHCLFVQGEGTQARLEDAVVADNRFNSPEGDADLVAVAAGASLVAERSEFSGGAWGGLSSRGSLELREARVSRNGGFGVAAYDGGRVVLDGVEVEDSAAIGQGAMGEGLQIYGGSLEARRVRIRGSDWIGAHLIGATATLQQVEITGSGLTGLSVVESTATLRDSRVFENRSALEAPVAVYVAESDFTVENVEISDNDGYGLAIRGGLAELRGLRVSGARQVGEFTAVHGLAVFGGAAVRAEALESVGNGGPGAAVAGAALDCAGCRFQDNQFAGVVASTDARVVLTGAEISGNGPHPNEGGGFGVYAYAGGPGGALTLTGSAVGGHAMAGVFLEGPSAFLLSDNALCGATPPAGAPRPAGNAVALFGTTGAVLEGNTLYGSGSEAVFVHAGEASFTGNTWSDNAVELHWQGGPCPTPEVEPVCPIWDLPVAIPVFAGVAVDVEVEE